MAKPTKTNKPKKANKTVRRNKSYKKKLVDRKSHIVRIFFEMLNTVKLYH